MVIRAYFVVRAVVPDPDDRAAFDRWYETEHIPDALRAFGVSRAFRAWSRTDPAVHCAYYEFPSAAAAEAATPPEVLGKMIAEFDRNWQGKVTRSREIFEVVQEV